MLLTHALARHRPVKGVTLTGLPDLARGRNSIRCDILSQFVLDSRFTNHIA
jgi:hypothetical protein